MNKAIYTVGFWAGLLATVFTLAYVVVQLLQVAGVLRFPWDGILIYGSSQGIVLPLLLAMLALHYTTPEDKRFWTHAALLFTVIYAVYVTANYVVQLATVIPAYLRGTASEIRLLDQTPHSMFWNFDALGYIFMGLATLIAVPAFRTQGFERWVRLSFLVHGLVTPLVMIVYFYPTFTPALIFLALPWAVTAPVFMLLLALLFRRQRNTVPVTVRDGIRSTPFAYTDVPM